MHHHACRRGRSACEVAAIRFCAILIPISHRWSLRWQIPWSTSRFPAKTGSCWKISTAASFTGRSAQSTATLRWQKRAQASTAVLAPLGEGQRCGALRSGCGCCRRARLYCEQGRTKSLWAVPIPRRRHLPRLPRSRKVSGRAGAKTEWEVTRGMASRWVFPHRFRRKGWGTFGKI